MRRLGKFRSLAKGLTHFILAAAIIAGGLWLMSWLASWRQAPARRNVEESVLSVAAALVSPRDERMYLTGYGTVILVDAVAVSPQVRGTVVAVHEDLDVGKRVAADAVLCRIDAREFELAVAAREAELTVLTAQAEQLTAERANLERLLTVRRGARDLAAREHQRLQDLLQTAQIGTVSDVERAEQAVVQTDERITEIENALTMIPVRLATIEAQRRTTEQQLALDQLNLSRCVVRAPVAGRLQQVAVEVGQYVNVGVPIATIADDSRRELVVSLEGRDVERWMQFAAEAPAPGWFRAPRQISAEVTWLERRENIYEGQVDRIAAFDTTTRTVDVVLRIPQDSPLNSRHSVPLVAGMFCQVRIPGNVISDATTVPRTAMTQSGELMSIDQGRLVLLPVELVYERGDSLIVHGVKAETMIVTGKIITPVIGMRLQPVLEPSLANPSAQAPTGPDPATTAN